MAQIAPLVGTGINRSTGKVLAGWSHVMQSLGVIFSTSFGERVMRRHFGSFVPVVLGEKLVPSTLLKFWTAICVAIEIWEPRYKVTRIVPAASPEQMRQGILGYRIEGVYRPRGHLGDFTPEARAGRFFTIGGRPDEGVRVLPDDGNAGVADFRNPANSGLLAAIEDL